MAINNPAPLRRARSIPWPTSPSSSSARSRPWCWSGISSSPAAGRRERRRRPRRARQYAQLKAVGARRRQPRPGGGGPARMPLLQRQHALLQALIDQRNQKNSTVKFIAAVPTNDKPEEAQKLVSEETQKFSAGGAQPDAMVNLDFAADQGARHPHPDAGGQHRQGPRRLGRQARSEGREGGAEDAVGTALFRAPLASRRPALRILTPWPPLHAVERGMLIFLALLLLWQRPRAMAPGWKKGVHHGDRFPQEALRRRAQGPLQR